MLDQFFAFAILLGILVLLVWDRLRYDLVAVLGLLAGIACGIIPADQAFTGFGDEIVILVGSALVVSAAMARSGLAEAAIRWLSPSMRTPTSQVAILVTIVVVMSAFVKNIGAVAMLMPIALQIARRAGTPPSFLLMPLSFGSLIGGLITLIGTSPNIIVSRMRADLLGEPFRMFDFAPVGIGLAVAGLAFLVFGWRLLPASRTSSGEALFEIQDYTTEVRVPPDSPVVGRSVAELEARTEEEVTVTSLIREGYRRYVPRRHWVILEGDILVLEGDANGIKRALDSARLELVPEKEIPVEETGSNGHASQVGTENLTVMEAVVGGGSELVGKSAEQLQLRERYALNILAISRRGRRLAQRLRRVRFMPGDVVVLQGFRDTIADTAAALGCLPLAERQVELGRRRPRMLPLVILLAAVALVVAQVVPVAVGFLGAAAAMLLSGALTLDEAYRSVEWPILVLLGALIPVSKALETTGATGLMAAGLSVLGEMLPPGGMLALVLFAAMAVTPFLNNAATVLVMAPVAAGLAQRLGLNPDPFLMAVAVGAACDFLTPIGHQCNTLVMGPGGYRFGDYWRLGLPLSIIVLVLGSALIAAVWPLRAA